MRSLDGCPGAAASYCYTNHLWSGEGGQYHLVGGSFVVTPGGATYAFSVRCVLDMDLFAQRLQTNSVTKMRKSSKGILLAQILPDFVQAETGADLSTMTASICRKKT